MNLSWFFKNIEMAIHCWTDILKRARHFIFTQDADNLTKPNTQQKKVLQTPPQMFFKG